MSAPYEELEKVFHEPNRLAIVSELSGSADGEVFSDLRRSCGLTDGNLSRHLSALEKAGVVRIEKSFVGVKPRTTVFLTETGREGFLQYLAALAAVLQSAASRASEPKVARVAAAVSSVLRRKQKPA